MALFVAIAFVRSVFAAGLMLTSGGIALGEVQPGEAIEKTVVISNDAERAIAVSRVGREGSELNAANLMRFRTFPEA